MERIVYLSGLPRSGSTLLCNLIAEHPQAASTPSSPLCAILQGMKRQWSDDPFLLSQLDNNPDDVHERLTKATRGFMAGFMDGIEGDVVVDKNRGWLACIELLRHLNPGFRMIVTLRDLRDVFASVEKHHRKTPMLDFPDHMDANIVSNRAESLFANGGLIGRVLSALHNVGDIPNAMDHLFIWRYEDFIMRPQESMDHLFAWLRLPKHQYDFSNIKQVTFESDSYHRLKYPHHVAKELNRQVPRPAISPRIVNTITNKYGWYYKQYYKDCMMPQATPQQPVVSNTGSALPLAEELDRAISKEVGFEQ